MLRLYRTFADSQSSIRRAANDCLWRSFCVRAVWVTASGMASSLLIAPLTVAACRRKSTRLAAALGGLAMTLAFLFTSFAHQVHQVSLR